MDDDDSTGSSGGIKGFWQEHRFVVDVAAIVIVALAVFLAMGGAENVQDLIGQDYKEPTGNFSDYAQTGEATGTTEAEGYRAVATFKITDIGIVPARVEISPGQAVAFNNTRSFPVRIEFDRTPQTPVVQPGETFKMRFRGITYFTVYNANTGKELGRGSVNVQS